MIDAREIERAVSVLRAGGLVAFPTETVYGLGADASNAQAVRKVFAAKGRPEDHPLIVHLADAVQLGAWARDIPPAAHALARRFWPGPLTLILKRATGVCELVTGGQDTVAVRVPSHPVAQALLRAFGGGIAAPSANRYGHVSATTAEHVRLEFGSAVSCVLDGGACDVGIESTIVDLSGAQPALLRPGGIAPQALAQVLGSPLAGRNDASPRVPGALAKHYAPRTPITLVDGEDLLIELVRSMVRQGRRVAVLALASRRPVLNGIEWIGAPVDAAAYAHDLYANLRQLDAAGCDVMIVQQPPDREDWLAVRDRLGRAAGGADATAIT